VHVRGALANGCSAEEIRESCADRDVLRHPAANDAHRCLWKRWGIPREASASEDRRSPAGRSDLAAADRVSVSLSHRVRPARADGLPRDSDLVRPGGGRIPRRRSAPFAARADRLELRGALGQLRRLRPISVRPDCWGNGSASRLLEPTMARSKVGASARRGFTFPQSPKHVALYRSSASAADLDGGDVEAVEPPQKRGQWSTYTSSSTSLRQCSELTEEIFPGLDLRREILALRKTRAWRDGSPSAEGFAACHIGKGSEPEAAWPTSSRRRASRSRCASPARPASRGLRGAGGERGWLEARRGVNTSRHAAYRRMAERGFARFSTRRPCSARTRPATTVPTASSSTTGAEQPSLLRWAPDEP